jgi:SOS-response transcriptional repressor LexA
LAIKPSTRAISYDDRRFEEIAPHIVLLALVVVEALLDGDYVIVRQQETADDGDIVVALIGSDATLKRFIREKNGVRLDPANPGMAPIYVRSGVFRIQGKVVGIQRFLDSNVGLMR